MAEKTNELALVKRDTVDIVSKKVREFQERGEINFPASYSPENAMKSAWLVLQETYDKNKKRALEACTRDSIANSLLSMVVQGLNPDKKQCYFIVYGNQLTLQRSYFGSMAVAKRVCPEIKDIIADVVYRGDGFSYEKAHGKTIVTTHTQSIENIDKNNIIAAYCTIIYKDGTDESAVMTLEQIKQAWKQSKMYPIDDNGNIKSGTTHDKFTEEMCKKTVINRACKAIINSSDDSSIVVRMAKSAENDAEYAAVREEDKQNANKQEVVIDDYTVDTDTGEIGEAASNCSDNADAASEEAGY